MKRTKLVEPYMHAREYELLDALNVARCITMTYSKGWARPMDIGARDASWHSGLLRRMCNDGRGLVERRGRWGLMAMISGHPRSWVYRITRKGQRALRRFIADIDEWEAQGGIPALGVRMMLRTARESKR